MAHRFIHTSEGDNLSSIANRLFEVEDKRRLTELRRRLLELNPHLPERKNIPEGVIVVVPAEFDGERPKEKGTTFQRTTGGVLDGYRAAVDQLGQELERELEQEAVRQKDEQAAHSDRRLRQLAGGNPALQERLDNIAKAQGERAERTKRLEQLRGSGLDQLREDLDAIAALGGNLPIG